MWFLLVNFHENSRPQLIKSDGFGFSFKPSRLKINFVSDWEGWG
jgi:hypothetical protein